MARVADLVASPKRNRRNGYLTILPRLVTRTPNDVSTWLHGRSISRIEKKGEEDSIEAGPTSSHVSEEHKSWYLMGIGLSSTMRRHYAER